MSARPLALALFAALILFFVFPSHGPATPYRLGVDLPSGFYDPAAVQSFGSTIGQHVGIVQNFVGWDYTANATWNRFPTTRVEAVIQAGSTPEITWDPTITGDPVNQPSMSLASITAGTHDHYIRQFAEAAKAVGKPILLRFAHEMNGAWTSYCQCNSGNHTGDFVNAWRHVWNIFHRVGATNVRWIWSPDAGPAGERSLKELYPGNAYVNWTGLDGYSYPLGGCKSPAQIFGPALREIRSFSDRPVMLAEVAVASTCPNPAGWITRLFSWLKANPTIKSLTWWQRTSGGTNWLVNSSAESLAAFKVGLAGLAGG
jgi:hypothetical protein